MSKRIKITDFAQDDRNFNKHTSEGMELLKKSIETVGVIESFTVSNDDKIISGNARSEKINEVLGDSEPIVVETDGSRPVVLKRTDIKSGTKKFHEAAILANTTAKKNINLDAGLIQEIAVEEFDIDVYEIGVEIINAEDFGDEFSLPSGDKSPFQQMSFTLSDQQADLIKYAMEQVKNDIRETFGNENSNGNKLYTIVKQWEEQRK